MKKILLALSVGLLIFGCEKDDATINYDDVIIETRAKDDNNGKDRVKICHNGKTIMVAPEAVPGHLGHGDVEEACFTCYVPDPETVKFYSWNFDNENYVFIIKDDQDVFHVLFYHEEMCEDRYYYTKARPDEIVCEDATSITHDDFFECLNLWVSILEVDTDL